MLAGAAIVIEKAPGELQALAAPSTAAVQRGGEVVQAQAFTYASLDLHLSSYSLPAGYNMLFEYLLRYELTDAAANTFAFDHH